MPLRYHFPLYRPPSEGNNLIIQATLGCSFNQCSFCSMYRSKTYAPRPLEAVFADIATAAREWPEAHRVFLADGDALILPTATLLALCHRLGETFPNLHRISCYATPQALHRKTPEELEALRAARLSLVYGGIESGDGDTLKRIRKGASPNSIVRAVEKAQAAGIKVSATVILGLAGESHWQAHVAGTAAVLNACAPTFASTLQLGLEEERVAAFLADYQRVAGSGPFLPRDDAGMLEELEALVSQLAPPRPIIFRSNHASNALPLAGTLPKDKARLLADIAAARRGAQGLRPMWSRGL